jgi:hypothetical protein
MIGRIAQLELRYTDGPRLGGVRMDFDQAEHIIDEIERIAPICVKEGVMVENCAKRYFGSMVLTDVLTESGMAALKEFHQTALQTEGESPKI